MDIYVIKRKSPLDQTEASYPALCTPHKVDTEQIVEDMVAESTLTRHDIVGVLDALQKQVRQNVLLGKSTSLGDFGLVSYSLKAKKQAAQKDVAATDIKRVHVRFKASTALRKFLQPDGGHVHFVLRADKNHTPIKKTTVTP